MVKTLNSGLKCNGFESNQDNVCFFLQQENLLQLLHSTQVRMGTWPFGSFVLSLLFTKTADTTKCANGTAKLKFSNMMALCFSKFVICCHF